MFGFEKEEEMKEFISKEAEKIQLAGSTYSPYGPGSVGASGYMSNMPTPPEEGDQVQINNMDDAEANMVSNETRFRNTFTTEDSDQVQINNMDDAEANMVLQWDGAGQWQAINPPLAITPHNTEYTISISQDHEMLATLYPDGSVEYGENYEPDAAAGVFWEALGKGNPCKLHEEIDELKEQLDAANNLIRCYRNDRGETELSNEVEEYSEYEAYERAMKLVD